MAQKEMTYILDTVTSTWSTSKVLGVKPHLRAGMTLIALKGRLYIFGGSDASLNCSDDLEVLNRKEAVWPDVNDEPEEFSGK